MFTTLNLTLTSQLPQDSNALLTADGQPVPTDATFAASLDLSIETELLAGNALPDAGGELPSLDAMIFPGATDESLPDTAVLDTAAELATPEPVVAWPPGLEPPASEGDKPLAADDGVVYAIGQPDADAPPVIFTPDARVPTMTDVPPIPPRADRLHMLRSTVKIETMPRIGAVIETLPNVELESAPDVWVERGLVPAPELRSAAALGQDAPPLRTVEFSLSPGASGGDLTNAVQATSNLAAQASRAPANGSVASTLPTISTPVGEPEWADNVADRVLMMTNTRLGNAEIRLTPAELGPVRVQVSVDDGTATIAFQATQAATREALEQAMPRLREMLAESGISLGQASVSEHGVRDGERQGRQGEAVTGDPAAEPDAEQERSSDEQPAHRVVTNALVDTFA